MAPDAATQSTPSATTAAPVQPGTAVPVGWVAVAVLLALVSVGAVWFGWQALERVRALEETLVKRQQTSQEQVVEARLAARQAQEVARESAAKLALLELRVAESTVQRSQLEALMQSVARSREDNVLAELETSLRAALQQSAITGGTEPLLAALTQADERLARAGQPQLERVRRAIGSDIARVRAAAVADVAQLSERLDDTMRLVDRLPLLAQPQPRSARPARAERPAAVVGPASAASGAAPAPATWASRWQGLGGQLWGEVRSLVRITPIQQPEAMLLAPEQAFFLRENLKLRLLNARLALFSRQFDTAQSDLRDARSALDRYFDRSARPVQQASATLEQVAAQARRVGVPRPDATLAAIAAANAVANAAAPAGR